jgi:hypothetical protein
MIKWLRRVEQAVLRALLRRVDARSLTKGELLVIIDLLASALAVADPAPDLGEQDVGR